MLFSFFALITLYITAVEASLSHRQIARRLNHGFNMTRVPYGDDPAELVKRNGGKYIFMHHIVGNTYSYTINDWKDDIRLLQSKGVDALAMNIGSDYWQTTQLQSAYDAAQQLGTGFKLFISFDFTEMACNVNDIVSRVRQFSGHPSQFTVNGRVFISSFSGDCLGNGGWASLKSQTNGYIMPFIWGLENRFNDWSALDSWYCWGCAWPQGNFPKTIDDDNYYLGQLGTRYATTISGWFYTHYNYKNFYLRGDDWLVVNRWEQLVAMRNQLTFVEITTWNDFGESDYFGPIKGAQPAGTTWATNFPHTAWFDMSAYYITAFKTGNYPPITQDVIYFWARPHPAGATASGDSLGKPTGWDWTEDTMWAAVFATAQATVTLRCGSSFNSFNVNAGVNKLKIPLAPGKMTVQMIRNGQTIINYTPDEFTYITNPVVYNYNAWVGSATASNSSPAPPPPTTTTTSTSLSSSPTNTPTNAGYTYLHCYQDDNSRILSQSTDYNNAQTVDKCLAKCASGGYAYAGLEYGRECYCSNTLRANAVQAPEGECAMRCAGDGNQICGGSWRSSVYKTSTSASSWTSYGCVAEGTTGSRRALVGASFVQSNMTPQLCQNLCSGYQYAGVEYSTECYCGNSLTNNGASGAVIPSSFCSNNCGGDSSQKCGGSWTLSVYKK